MKIVAITKAIADAIGALLFLFTFAGFVVQVFWRYALNAPLPWTEEAVLIAFVWSVFWATAFMVPLRAHVTFDVVHDAVSPRTRRVFDLVSMAALLGAFVLLIPYTWDYLDFLTRKKSPVMRLPMHWVFSCYILFVVAVAVQAAWRIGQILRPRGTS
ncbi:TRAP transporter small permease [Oceaniglobus indicus]|uniref:TRAP transporter small permease n=1 Tax=Oceaniglobus indicus TaxID=2047749 RepID=UPI000C197A18|nr:TRAP transporter small permease subunit [Oceaniglobus indicus]